MSRKNKTQRRAHPARHNDPRIALASADAFRGCARPFLQRVVGKHIDAAKDEAGKDIGGVVSSATNLTLGVELYLKALWILNSKRVPDTHHLWTLFKNLPDELRSNIQATYDRAPRRPEFETVRLELEIAPPGAKEEDDSKPTAIDYSVRAVLLRASDAFVNWRYLHEAGHPTGAVTLSYEFHYLGLFADVLRLYVVEGVTQFEAALRKRNQDAGSPSR